MKRILSLLLAAVMLVSAVPTAFAADTNDYSAGTKVEFTAANNEAYTITVPALLAPGGSGSVTLSGTWPDNRTVSVTADPTVTLTSSIKATDTKTLDVNFAGISEAGSNIEAQTFTKGISVDPIENAIFGTWSGKFNYNVEAKTGGILEGDGQTFHTMAPSTLSFRSTAPLSEFQEVKVNGVTVDPSNYTLTEGSTIVTLSIDYLKTLDVAAHEITVISDSGSPSAGFSVVEPFINTHGFYYNQPYAAYVDALSYDVAFFVRTDGTADVIAYGDASGVENCSYTVEGNNIVLNTSMGTMNATISDDGMEIYVNEVATTFSLNAANGIVADDNYVYIYDDNWRDNWKGFEILAFDKSKASYPAFKSNINGIPVTQIGSAAFENCEEITSFSVPEGIVLLGPESFGRCTNLTEISIPKTMETINQWAFNGCDNLRTITFNGTIIEWNAISIGDGLVNIPDVEVICSDGTVSLT